jgi:hypothetical protein
MVAAAACKKDEQDDTVKDFWVAVNPVGPAGAPGYAIGGYYRGYLVGWAATPWGAAYGVRY